MDNHPFLSQYQPIQIYVDIYRASLVYIHVMNQVPYSRAGFGALLLPYVAESEKKRSVALTFQ